MTCPYRKRTCAPVSVVGAAGLLYDLWTTAEVWLHRHDHRRCLPAGAGWWHPDDDPVDLHLEPEVYTYARHPLQLRWPGAWRVVASSLLLVKTSRHQVELVTEALFRRYAEPVDLRMAEGELERLLGPLGLAANRARYLRAMGLAWHQLVEPLGVRPPAEFVAGLPGCGPYVVQAYRIFALGENLEPETVGDPVLRLHLELRRARVPR